MKKIIACVFLCAFIFNSYADAQLGLGKLLYKGDLEGEWLYVVGEKDSFIMSKSGRFSIYGSADGGLQVTDLWQQQAITFKEMHERVSLFPITEIVSKTKHKPLRIGNLESKAKYSVFLKVGDEFSIDFYNKAYPDLISKGADIFAVPSEDFKLFYSYACGDDDWKKEILKGTDLITDLEKCNQALLNKSASQIFAMTNLLGIKRVPFVIVNNSGKGLVVDYKVFKGMFLND
jgi:hypothetical protein